MGPAQTRPGPSALSPGDPIALCSKTINANTLNDADRAKVRLVLRPVDRPDLSREGLAQAGLPGGTLQRSPWAADHTSFEGQETESDLIEWRSRVFENGALTFALIEHQLPDGGVVLENLHTFREDGDLRPARWSSGEDVTFAYRAPGSDEVVQLLPCAPMNPSSTALEITGLEGAQPLLLLRQVDTNENGGTIGIRRIQALGTGLLQRDFTAGGHWALTFGDESYWRMRVDFRRELENYQLYFRDEAGGEDERALEHLEFDGQQWRVSTLDLQTGARAETTYQGGPRWRRVDLGTMNSWLEGRCEEGGEVRSLGEPNRYLVHLLYCPEDGPGLEGLQFIVPVMLTTDFRYLGRRYSKGRDAGDHATGSAGAPVRAAAPAAEPHAPSLRDERGASGACTGLSGPGARAL